MSTREAKRFAAAVLPLLAAGFLALPPASALTTARPKGDVVIDVTPACSGLASPVTATHAGDRSGRLFVVDQVGPIRILDQRSDRCRDEPFLDLRDRIVEVNPNFDERGLLGLAVHPRFRKNGRLFVRYSAPREGAAGEPCFGTSRGCHDEILAEFRVTHRHANAADRASERILFRDDEPQFNHNSGHVAFGPDGFLYFTLGDGVAVIGGFVERGRKYASLFGTYVFGDFTQTFVPAAGRLCWLDGDGVRSDIFEFRITANDVPLGLYLLGFGEDEAGEPYVLTSQNLGPGGESGRVWRTSVPGDRPVRGHDRRE